MSRSLRRVFVSAIVITAIVVTLVLAVPRSGLSGLGGSQEPLACRRIQVSTDRALYENGSTATIHVEYTHLLPECSEALSLHAHTIVVDVNGVLLDKWNSTGDSAGTITWVSSSKGALGTSITIRACEEEAQRLVLCSSSDVIVTSRPFTQIIPLPSIALEMATIALVCIAAGLGVGLWFERFRER